MTFVACIFTRKESIPHPHTSSVQCSMLMLGLISGLDYHPIPSFSYIMYSSTPTLIGGSETDSRLMLAIPFSFHAIASIQNSKHHEGKPRFR